MATLRNRIVTGAGFKLIIRSGSVSEKVRDAVVAGLNDVATVYTKRVKDNINLDDHTLKQLAEMGHPYRASAPKDSVHGDDRLVHTQSGKLLRSIKKGVVQESTSRTFTVYVTSDDPVMPYLIYGTSRMRPRRFHEKAYEDIKSVYWKPLIDKLKKVEYRIEASARV